MASSDLVPEGGASDGSGSALRDFLNRSTIYETAGAVIPRDLLSFGLIGSSVVIATGVLALLIPSASIRSGGFFLVLGTQAADLMSLLHSLAVPAIVAGVALLLLDLWLLDEPCSEHWRSAVVVQATAGGISGLLGTLFLALLVLNLAIWIAIMVCIFLIIGLIVGAAAGG